MSKKPQVDRAAFEGRGYHPRAYEFVLHALEYTVGRLGKRRHVSGQELLGGILECARETYGPMSAEVFRFWGVRQGIDFGEIVWDLIDLNLLSKRQEDSKQDFSGEFDFESFYESRYNYLTGFRVVSNSMFPHAVPIEKGPVSSGSHGSSLSFQFDA